MERNSGARLLSGLIAALTVLGTGIMLTNHDTGILTVYGLSNLKFFTVQSNLLVGIVHLLALLLPGRRLWLERLSYVATTAVMLTFTVVVCFFGPSLGYGELFRGANLFFHLIIPLLSAAHLCVFRRNRPISMGETAAALIPTVLYGTYYTAVLLVRGVHFPETDWYGFAAGGVVGSVITAAVILLLTWALALLLRLLAGGKARRCSMEKAGEGQR